MKNKAKETLRKKKLTAIRKAANNLAPRVNVVEENRKKATANGIIYVRRNDRCPCSSGKKAKDCCLNKIRALAALSPAVRERVVVALILGHDPFVESQPVPEAVQARFAAIQESFETAQEEVSCSSSDS